MSRWLNAAILPSALHILCRLPGKVCPSFYYSTVCFIFTCTLYPRILIASIRNLGNCPCPRCEIELSKVHNVGMPLDRKQRRTKARHDNTSRRDDIRDARALIYDHGHLVNSAEVERMLKPKSLVPTAVSAKVMPCEYFSYN